MTPRKPGAERRYAGRTSGPRRASGPKTEAGRRRAALNGRRLVLSSWAIHSLERLKGDARELEAVWRDLLGIFWFLDPQLERFLFLLAWDFWLKAHLAREGAPSHVIHSIDSRLEKRLAELAYTAAIVNRKWRCRFAREVGSTGRAGFWHLRALVEPRIGLLEEQFRKGKLPHQEPMERELTALIDLLGEAALGM